MESGTSKDGHNNIEARTSSDVPQTLHTEVLKQTTLHRIDLGDSVVYANILVVTIFGAIYCAAWNFHFPTAAESILWKVSSLMTTVLPVFVAYSHRKFYGSDKWVVVEIVAVFIYVPIRLYLLVEVFAGLRSLPISAY